MSDTLEQRNSPPPRTVKSKITIIVAEDNRFQRIQLCDLLEAQGYRVLAFPGGKSALKANSIVKADLIITDLMMEDGEGISTILEAQKGEKPARIIAISSNPKYLQYAGKLGADLTMQKPLKAQDVIDNVEALLSP